MRETYLAGSAAAVADSFIARNGILKRTWSYDYGVVWRGMEMLEGLTGERKYFDYIRDGMDSLVDGSGNIRDYQREAFNLDYLCNGRQLILLWERTGEEKYRTAARMLRSQLNEQPRTSDGGFWHKQIYPFQMWLDGQHMAIPFWLQYEKTFGPDETAREDAACQLILAWQHTLNPKTGLPCHGWDEKRIQNWADPETGRAAHAWGRAVGWYMVALADSLELLPEDNRHYSEVLKIFRELSGKLLLIREDGVWNQVLDCPGRTGNYPESSASCLITYSLLKGARLRLLPDETGLKARQSFLALQRHFLGRMRNGEYFIAKCCQGAGLGGNSRRDGSFDYYISENIISRDPKATGAYIQAACEEQLAREGEERDE